jgi:hypothetical protein
MAAAISAGLTAAAKLCLQQQCRALARVIGERQHAVRGLLDGRRRSQRERLDAQRAEQNLWAESS